MLFYLNFALLELLLPRPAVPHAIQPDKALPVGVARPLDYLTPQPINDPEPADIGKHREPQQEQRDQYQTGANRIEGLIEACSDGRTKNTASTLRQPRVASIVERTQGGGRYDQQQQAQCPKTQ